MTSNDQRKTFILHKYHAISIITTIPSSASLYNKYDIPEF